MDAGKGLLRSPHGAMCGVGEVSQYLTARDSCSLQDGGVEECGRQVHFSLLHKSCRCGMGLCWRGTQSSAQPFAKAGFPHQDSGKYFVAKRLIQRNSLRVFYQDRGSAWPGVSQAVPSAPAALGAPVQAPWNRAQLGCGDCTDLLSILSSAVLMGSPKIGTAGSSDNKASESLGFSECESRNFSAALGGLPSSQQVSPSPLHLALQVGQWQSW